MQKQYPILYSRTSTGAIQIWQIFVDEDRYWTVSGQIDGLKVTSEPTVAQGKNLGKSNETSSQEQSLIEAEAKQKKKLEKDYHLNINDIDKPQIFEVQLAKEYSKYADDLDWNKGLYISPKIDGMRCITTRYGMFSRNGKTIVSAPHIFNSLKEVFDKFPDLILDFEIYSHRLCADFNKIMSLAKKTKPDHNDLIESKQYLEAHVFDMPSLNLPFCDRWEKIKEFFNDNLKENKYFKLVPHFIVHSVEEVEKWLGEYMAQFYEGVMLNTPDAYYQGRRTRDLLKYKKFQTEEFPIVSITEGIGNRSGLFGYATLRMPQGHTFDANARGDENLYRKILQNKNKYINKLATVRYQNLTSGENPVPRFPVIIDFDRFD